MKRFLLAAIMLAGPGAYAQNVAPSAGTLTGPVVITSPSNLGFTVKVPDGDTALVLANSAGIGRFEVNIDSTGGWTLYDLGGGTYNPALSALNGNLTVGGYVTNGANGNQSLGAGAALNSMLSFSGALSGTKSGGSQALSILQTTSDTVAAGAAGLIGQYINMTDGGTGTTGNRVGEYINLNFAGGTTNKSLAVGSQYAGFLDYAKASGNVGGTSGFSNAYGTLWGGVASCTLASGATFWNACIGMEIDMGVSAGASAAYVQGAKIVLANHAQAVQATDYMLGFAEVVGNPTQIGNVIAIGSPDGFWPLASNGSIMTTLASNIASPPAQTAAHGIDLSGVTFSSDAYKSTGFLVDGSGNVTGNAYKVGATAGVSCAANTVSLTTLVVTNGIITHC